jgi:hypothetical protein
MQRSRHVLRALAFGGALAGTAGTAAASQPGYNGTWSVRMVQEAGACGSSNAFTVAIVDGHARIQGGGDTSIEVSGEVGPDGDVALTLHRSVAVANASGHLHADAGTGTWHVKLLGCSGRWTAERRPALQARAQ